MEYLSSGAAEYTKGNWDSIKVIAQFSTQVIKMA